jgi:glycosyltransferase involved in cell wall biosynthesis
VLTSGTLAERSGGRAIGFEVVRILIFHAYLLSGTGSNVYNARLAEALTKLGHEVQLFSQDRHPERHAFVGAVGDWDSGSLQLSAIGEGPSSGCTVYRPNIGGLLPLYVQDRYEGVEAKTFANCSEEEIARYIEANVAAVREVAERVRPDVALANHLVMGPVILARALRGKTPYAVKVHGSALEYTVKPQPERFLGFASEGLAPARTVLVGSRHTAKSLWKALGPADGASVGRRTYLGPPGVDVERFRPREAEQAQATMRDLLEHLRARVPASMSVEESASAFARDDGMAADAIEEILEGSGPLVAFVGKLIVSKGVDLLIAAWPLVLRSVPDARLAIVGFGAYRAGLEQLLACLADGDLAAVEEIARFGRALEAQGVDVGLKTANAKPLHHLLAFLTSLSDVERQAYCTAARPIAERVVLTGRLDHEELADILPACEALVVPSTFPEAFGMVAVEAAACGVLPVSAGHSGLAEVSEALAEEVPSGIAEWLSFPVDDDAVRAIAERVVSWLQADQALKAQARSALVAATHERWSWEGVARGVIAAARGEPVGRPLG